MSGIDNSPEQTVPLGMVGSTKFGRYPKISIEQTFNMYISDGFLVPFAGYVGVASVQNSQQGRGIYASTKLQKAVVVIDNGVYLFDPFNNNQLQKIATINSTVGDVFMDENNANQIALCDKRNIYILNYTDPNNITFVQVDTDFTPGYVSFQDGYFIAPDVKSPPTAAWRLSEPNKGTSWPNLGPNSGGFQTKPNLCLAAIRMPSKSNELVIFGQTVTELWYDTGAQLFPYQKNSYANLDFGCLNPATIASNDDMIVFLAANEKSGPTIMVMNGAEATQISTDGINHRLTHLTNPEDSYGFLFRQGGHNFYILTFPTDNLTYVYDFTQQAFFTLTDENMDYFIAKHVAFLNNTYYFVSFQDGVVYELNSNYTNYNGARIPRIRITPPFRNERADRFVVNNVTFTMEQGQSSNAEQKTLQGIVPLPENWNYDHVDLAISTDGGESFGSFVTKQLNPPGVRKNRLNFWNLGASNDLTMQFQFWSNYRQVIGEGVMSLYR